MPLRSVKVLLCLMIVAAPAMAMSCSVSTTGVALGNYTPLSGTATSASGTLTVSCTTLVALLVSYQLNISVGDSGSYFPRQLASGTHRLNYNLYVDPAHTAIWGDGSSGTSNRTFGALIEIGVTTQYYSVFGLIPASQNAVPGQYSDTLLVTIEY